MSADKTIDWKPDQSDAAYTSMRDGCYAGWEDFARALYAYNRSIDTRFNALTDELTATKRKLDDALADAASWQQQADARLNDAVEFGRRAEKAEARVKELEGLPVMIAKESGKAVWFSVQIPHDRWIEDGATLGAVIPRKDQ